MEKKITYVDALTAVIEGEELTPEIIEKLTALRNVQQKRNSSKSMTKTQKANEALRSQILGEMEMNTSYTPSEMIKNLLCCEGLSTQKLTPQLTTLVREGSLVVNENEKHRKVYSLAPVEE